MCFPHSSFPIFVTSTFILSPTVSIFFLECIVCTTKRFDSTFLPYIAYLFLMQKKTFFSSKVSQKKCGVNAVVLPPQNHLRRRRCHRGKRKLLQQQLLPQAGRAFFNLCISLHRLPPPNLRGGGKDIADSLQPPPPPPPLLYLTQQQPTHRHRSGWRRNEPAMKEGGIRQVFF